MVQPPLRKAMRSERSLDAAIPAKAIAFPGAKSAGDLSHLSKLPSVHLSVAFAYRADEQLKPSPAAMLFPGNPPRAGPVECD